MSIINTKSFHVITEVIVGSAITLFFFIRTKKMYDHIEDLETKIQQQEEIIQNHENIIIQLLQNYNMLNEKFQQFILLQQLNGNPEAFFMKQNSPSISSPSEKQSPPSPPSSPIFMESIPIIFQSLSSEPLKKEKEEEVKVEEILQDEDKKELIEENEELDEELDAELNEELKELEEELKSI